MKIEPHLDLTVLDCSSDHKHDTVGATAPQLNICCMALIGAFLVIFAMSIRGVENLIQV